MYHDVVGAAGDRGGFPGDGPDVYSVTARGFADQLDRIAEAVGRPPVTADAVAAGDAADGSWLITFDDGGASAVAAGEELARRGWPGHFFVVSDLVGKPRFVDREQVRALADQGHVIGSHSRTHPKRISDCAWEQQLDEWSHSTELLSEAIGRRVTTGSVPGGYYSASVGRAAVAAGLTTLFTSDPVRSTRSIEGCLLIGRYAVRRGTTADEAAAAAAGEGRPWLRQRASWEARGLAKRLAGRNYERLRAGLLTRRRS